MWNEKKRQCLVWNNVDGQRVRRKNWHDLSQDTHPMKADDHQRKNLSLHASLWILNHSSNQLIHSLIQCFNALLVFARRALHWLMTLKRRDGAHCTRRTQLRVRGCPIVGALVFMGASPSTTTPCVDAHRRPTFPPLGHEAHRQKNDFASAGASQKRGVSAEPDRGRRGASPRPRVCLRRPPRHAARHRTKWPTPPSPPPSLHPCSCHAACRPACACGL